jgi:hypothetical protein
MSSKKMIQINPNFLSLSKKNKTSKSHQKKKKRKDLRMSIKPNNIKKKLIQKIKEHQKDSLERRKIGNINQEDSKDEEDKKSFTKDFNDQLSYLEEIIKKKKEKRMKKKMRRQTKRRKSLINPNIINNKQSNISVPNTPNAPQMAQPSIYKPPSDPPYGCLKNGNKPTYSQYRRTLKMRENPNPNKLITQEQINPKPSILIDNTSNIQPSLVTREDKLQRLKTRLATPKKEKGMQRLVKVKRTIKKYKLGKNKKDKSVGILIKSGKTRKLVKNEQKILRKKCLSEIKQYLRKHNIIKSGSSAPERVLRKLYEDCFSTGSVYNKNADNLIHNYLNDE